MTLPKIMIPKFSVKLPSDQHEVTFRPFLVKEEKALLMAVEGEDQESIIRAIKDSITACVDDVDVSKLPFFDIEYLFLNLRAKSVGEEIKYSYKHRGGVNLKGEKCETSTEVVVKLDEINVKRDESHESKFMVDEKFGIKMKYPTIDSVREFSVSQNNDIALMASCIEFVYDSDNVYPPDTLEDAVNFIEQMNNKQYENLTEFFETMPKLAHEVTYKCVGCGQEDTVKFEGVADFF